VDKRKSLLFVGLKGKKKQRENLEMIISKREMMRE